MSARIYFLYAILLVWGSSCTKVLSVIKTHPNSSLTVVNGVDGSSSLLTTFSPDSAVYTFSTSTPQVGYGSSSEYSVLSGTTPVIIYQSSDTVTPLFKGQFTLAPDGIYSLFLSGILTGQNAPDTLLVMDSPPYHAVGDSTVGIRFVNISPGAGTISIDLLGNAPGSEVTSLPYKGVTTFKSYPATSTTPDPSTGYVFEFRSVATDSVLYTYTYNAGNLPLFKNVSLILAGTTAGSGIQAFVVNSY